MIGRRRLAAIAHFLEHQGSGQLCQGEFILQAQRLLYGSETVILRTEELIEVIAYLEAQRRQDQATERGRQPSSPLQAGLTGIIRDSGPPKPDSESSVSFVEDHKRHKCRQQREGADCRGIG